MTGRDEVGAPARQGGGREGLAGARGAMRGGTLFGVGVAGAVLAAVCCATPILAILLGVLGLSAWLAWSDYVVIPALLVFLAVAVFGLIRWRQSGPAGCREVPTSAAKKG